MERIQKIISAAGYCSRRAAEELLRSGRVTVNGVAAALGQSADALNDIICVDGERISPCGERTYIMLNKPAGYVTTLSDEKGRKTVAELTSGVGRRVYPVGRLDLNSQGLLIMTDDGELAQKLCHPSHRVDKTYLTGVSGEDVGAAAEIMRGAMDIDGYAISPARVEVAGQEGDISVLSVTIHEGRNRQVRKMCAQAGLRVHWLRRVREGELELGGLPPGKWRYLDENEIEYLKNLS